MVAIKFVYNNTVRRVDIEVNKRESLYPSLRKLHKVAREIFEEDQGLVLPQELLLKYKDEEDDLITVTAKRELVEAFDCMIHKCHKIPKFIVLDKNPKKASQIAVETAQHALQSLNCRAVQLQQSLSKEIREKVVKFPALFAAGDSDDETREFHRKIPEALKETLEKVSDDARRLASEVEQTLREAVQKVNRKRVQLLAGFNKRQEEEPEQEEEEIRDEEEEPLLKNQDQATYVQLVEEQEPEEDQEELEEEESSEEEEPETEVEPEQDQQQPQQQEEDPFELQLTQLEDMGFNDRVKNRQLLEQYSGDIVATIRDLLDHLDM